MAEDLYKRMNEVVAQIKDLRNEVEDTSAQVDHLERQVAEQRAIIEALADAEGIDVDEIVAEVSVADEDPGSDGTEGAAAADASAEQERGDSSDAESTTAE